MLFSRFLYRTNETLQNPLLIYRNKVHWDIVVFFQHKEKGSFVNEPDCHYMR